MKRLALVALPLAPFVALLGFRLFPAWDVEASLPLFHFYIVTFTTFAALVLSILLSTALSGVAQPRYVLAAVAFAAMGALFFSHGFATPGALIAHAHPALRWSAWLTLFSGGFLFALASLERPGYLPQWLTLRRVVYGTVAAIVFYLLVALLTPAFLTTIDERVGPWHRQLIFLLTLALWFLAVWNLWRDWRVSRTRVDGALTFVAFWLTAATISLHQFPVWHLSWWLYHFLLLLSFLVASGILLLEHEQARQFRLVPYYLAFSLIFTALLTLVASDLFARFAYNLLREAPALAEALLRSRSTGLVISALMMTGLFSALLLVVQRANRIITTRTEQLNEANRQSDALLLNILPEHVAAELKESGRVNPVYYEAVTVMFTDVKDFTQIAATLTPQALIGELDYYFSHFDTVIRAHGLEKLKTIGDSYMCAGGVPIPSPTHAVDVVRAALEIQAFMRERKAQVNDSCWEMRIGIHSGPLVAGVIGHEKFAYDVWGETVNTADRMEGACEPGKINISQTTYELVKDAFECEPRGMVRARDGNEFEMYYVTGPKT